MAYPSTFQTVHPKAQQPQASPNPAASREPASIEFKRRKAWAEMLRTHALIDREEGEQSAGDGETMGGPCSDDPPRDFSDE